MPNWDQETKKMWIFFLTWKKKKFKIRLQKNNKTTRKIQVSKECGSQDLIYNFETNFKYFIWNSKNAQLISNTFVLKCCNYEHNKITSYL